MKDNKKLYLFTLYSNLIKTIITTLIGIVTVPISLTYFGTEKYGIWNVINSFMIYLSMSNLGLNAATSILMNKNNDYLVKIEILKKSLKIILSVLPLLVGGLFIFNIFFPNWINFINPPLQILNETKITTIVMIFFILLNIPFSLISSAIMGFQKNYIENMFVIVNSIVFLIGLFITVKLKKSLIFLAIIIGVTNLIVNILKTIYFKIYIINKNNHIKDFIELKNDDTKYKLILITGFRCLLGTMAWMLVGNTDNIVISKILGPEFVASYSITYKLFTLIFTLIYILNSSIVPLIGREINNLNIVKEIYKRTYITVVFFGGLMWLGSIGLFKIIIFFWTGENGYAGDSVVFLFGAYSYIYGISNLNYIVLNTFNYIKKTVLIVWIEGIINLCLSIVLIKYLGLAGVALGTFLATLITSFIFFPKILKRESNGEIEQNYKFLIKHFIISLLPNILTIFYFNKIIKNIYIMIFLTILCVLLYIVLFYKIVSNEYKKFILDNIVKMFKWRRNENI